MIIDLKVSVVEDGLGFSVDGNNIFMLSRPTGFDNRVAIGRTVRNSENEDSIDNITHDANEVFTSLHGFLESYAKGKQGK